LYGARYLEEKVRVKELNKVSFNLEDLFQKPNMLHMNVKKKNMREVIMKKEFFKSLKILNIMWKTKPMIKLFLNEED